MKNKGFTLIEMLIVIVLIGIILTLAIPSVVKLIESRSSDQYRYQVKLIEQGVNLYQARYRGEFNSSSTASCFILDYKILLDEELVSEQDIKCDGKIVLTRNAKNNLRKSYYLNCVDNNNVSFSSYKQSDLPSGCVVLGTETEMGVDTITAPTIRGGNSEWIPHNIEITVENSGIASSDVSYYEYYTSTSGINPSKYVAIAGRTSNAVTIDEEGTTYIWYRVVDKSGNVSGWSNKQVANIDKTTPAAPTITSTDGISSGGLHTDEFTLMFGGTNNISGNSYYYKFQDSVASVASAIKITEEYNGQTLRVQSCNGASVCSDWTTYVINIEIPTEDPLPGEPEGGE